MNGYQGGYADYYDSGADLFPLPSGIGGMGAVNPYALAGGGAPAGSLARVTTNDPRPAGDLNVRSSPSASASKVGGVAKGDVVTVLEVGLGDGSWSKVASEGGNGFAPVTGYAASRFLAPTNIPANVTPSIPSLPTGPSSPSAPTSPGGGGSLDPVADKEGAGLGVYVAGAAALALIAAGAYYLSK